MFQLTAEEFEALRSQIATSKGRGGRRTPYAFSEHGAVMLASVLNTRVAIQASIQVVLGAAPASLAINIPRRGQDGGRGSGMALIIDARGHQNSSDAMICSRAAIRAGKSLVTTCHRTSKSTESYP